LNCGGRAQRRHRFPVRPSASKSGVALRFPPQSKICGCGTSRVRFIRVHPWLMLFLLVLFAPVVRAQNAPHIGYVYPAGGRQGTTFLATVGGQFPSGITNFAMVLDGNLAPAKVVAYDRPLKAHGTAGDEGGVEPGFRKNGKAASGSPKLSWPDWNKSSACSMQFGRRPANPAISEFMTLQLTLATNLAPGDHEIRVRLWVDCPIRLSSAWGCFRKPASRIGKPCPRNAAAWTPRCTAHRGDRNAARHPERPDCARRRGPVSFLGAAGPATRHCRRGAAAHPVSGRCRAGLVRGRADDLRSQRQNAGERGAFPFKPDPVIHFEVPTNGTYTVEIHDSLYRRREDFVYRLTLANCRSSPAFFRSAARRAKKLPSR